MKMHLLYKICRADNPRSLCEDFRIQPKQEDLSYEAVQAHAGLSAKQFLENAEDVNCRLPEDDGATRLWLAAEQGHVEAVREFIKHPEVDPNRPKITSDTTPLFIASCRGHDDVVSVIVSHPAVQINRGPADTGISPLFMAVQQGREGVVEALLQHRDIDVNQSTTDGVTPLCKAIHLGLDHITELLVEAKGTKVCKMAQNLSHHIANLPSGHSSVASTGQTVVSLTTPGSTQEKRKIDEYRDESAVGEGEQQQRTVTEQSGIGTVGGAAFGIYY